MALPSKRPFWMHQLVEYILGGALVASGLQSPTPAVPSVLGGIVMLHAALTVGPAGAFRVLKRRLHQVIDVLVIAVELLAGVQPWIDLASATRIIIVGIALVHLFVWWQTNFAERVKTLSVSTEGGRSTEVGRIAGRLVGNGVNAVRRQRGAGR
ncbi:MAG TPA: hypothetical protein VHN36_01250 [Ilumatobacteraceae bacterium]|nr:hypothetical protein [Ilumatobacteraceae bacterium]